MDRLLRTGLVCNNAVVIEISNDREIEEALSGTNVGNVRYPLLVWTLGSKVSVQQIRIAVQSFSVFHIPLPPYNGKQTVFIHNSEHSFGIAVYFVPFEPNVYSAVAIGLFALSLALPDLLGQRQIFWRYIHSFHIAVIPAAGDAEDAAHFDDAVLFPMPVNDIVFYVGFHFLSVSERKSRSSSTSIFNRLFSYLYSCSVFAGLRPRCLGTP